MISGACGASMIGEKAGPNVPPSPFCLLFLEAPRGLGRVSARRPTRELRWRAARAVSMTPAYESSRCGAGLRSVARHQARRGIGVLMATGYFGASVSRAATRTPGHRPEQASQATPVETLVRRSIQQRGAMPHSARLLLGLRELDLDSRRGGVRPDDHAGSVSMEACVCGDRSRSAERVRRASPYS